MFTGQLSLQMTCRISSQSVAITWRITLSKPSCYSPRA